MKLEYDLIRTDRKTVGISVGSDGSVTVRAPQRLSVREIEKILEKNSAWINKKKLEMSERKAPILSDGDVLFLRRLAERYIPKRLGELSKMTGLSPQRIRISSAKRRFGSCSEKGSISISFYALLYPMEAVDLVLIHELCHLRHMDHSKAFYGLLSSFLPDFKERKKLLRRENMLTVENVREIYGEI